MKGAISLTETYHIYIGIPFCYTKCSYCHYTDNLQFGHISISEVYISTLLSQLKYVLERNKDKEIKTIYIGGGTPSLISISQIKKIKKILISYKQYPAEITLEIHPSFWNPSLLDLDFITRYSIGIQSIDQPTLSKYNRNYSVSQCYQIIEEIQSYSNSLKINIDFIFYDKLSINNIYKMNNFNVDSIVVYPNSKGRGSCRLKNVYNAFMLLKKELTNYRSLYNSHHIFIKEDPFTEYAKNEYEIFNDIIGIGHNSISYVGDHSYLSLYDKKMNFFYKHRKAGRYIECLINSSTTGIPIEKILQLDRDSKSFFCRKHENIYYLNKDNYISYYNYLLEKYSFNETQIFASVISFGDNDINSYLNIGSKV